MTVRQGAVLKYLDPGTLHGKAMKFTWSKRTAVMKGVDELPGSTKRALPDGGEDTLATYLKRTS